ncbi:MAG TPA: hypothetical protein VIA98_01315 [Allosphingosinicella sp.]|jgi:hypothetical protein
MVNVRWRLAAAALLAASLTGSPALGQETNTLGPAELRDFRLPGQRTTPPAPVQQPEPKASTPAPATATPAPATEPRPAAPNPPRPAAERRSQATPAPSPATTATPAAQPPQPAPQEPATVEPTEVAPLPVTVAPAQPQAAQPQAPAPAPARAASPPASGAFNRLWLAIPAALALLGFLALRRRRKGDDAEEDQVVETLAEAEPQVQERPRSLPQTPPPALKPAAKPALKLPPKVRAVPAAPPQPVGPRAILEVEFIPARASSTEEAAIVEFELVLKNVGDAPAGNIRIDTRMFNATATKEMAEFLKGPIHDESGSPHVQIVPGDELRLASAMAMPKQDVREIMMQGQRLFVPAVASIVAWNWGDGEKGRLSLSWLVGRETENKADKMGAFRLDLGPRIYRQVGVRPLKLVA